LCVAVGVGVVGGGCKFVLALLDFDQDVL
jgi:hypothetical protein